jgi:hypothetical protein
MVGLLVGRLSLCVLFSGLAGISVRAWPSQLWRLDDGCGLKNEARLLQMDSKYLPMTTPRIDLRKGVTDPVVL